MLRGIPVPPIFFPLAAFLLWLYLVLSYRPILQADFESARHFFRTDLFVGNIILVLAWFLGGRPYFAVFSALIALVTVYYGLVMREGGVWLHLAALTVLYFWLDHLSRTIENEKLVHLVEREKTRGELNLSAKALEEKEHLESALGRKEERLRYLRQFSDHLKGRTDLKEVCGVVIEEVAQLLPSSDQVLLYLIDPKSQELGLVCQHSREGRFEARAKKGDECDEWVIRRSQPLLIEDIATDFRFTLDPKTEDGGFRSSCIVPLVSERKVFAVLRTNAVKESSFHTDDLRFLDIVANLSAVSLRNVLLYEKTKELAIVDSLTECYLYRYVQERIAEEVHRSMRTKSGFAVLMADIDHFKKYNDEFGHTAGDMVLKGIAEILRSSAGPSDIVGRYGGEEFILVLPQKSRAQALEIAEAVRRKVSAREFHLRREVRNITISIGAAVFPESGTTREELLWKADKNLYEAKRKGRNQVCG